MGSNSGKIFAFTLLALQLPAANAEPWQFDVTPYFFAAAMDATADVGPVKTDVDMSASDVLEDTQNGFMAMMSARKDRWVVGLDASYFKLGDGQSESVTGPFGRTTVEGEVELTDRQWVYQPMLGYQVLDQGMQAHVYGGARYTRLRANLNVVIDTSIAAFPGGERSAKAEKEWTDFVVGGHLSLPLAERWSIESMADVGKGDDSDISYHFLVAAKWQFHPMMAASAGYRLLHQEYEDDTFAWDVTCSGLIMGVGFSF